jgi:hypothetical protein
VWSQLRHALERFWQSFPDDSPKQLGSTNARARFWAQVREGEREAEDASREGRSIGEALAPRLHEEKETCCKSVAPTTTTDAPS